MASTCFSSYYQCVFSTKHREKLISPDMAPELYSYIGGVARGNGMTAIAVGGMPDHIHVLLQMPSMLLVPKSINLIKGASSRWMNATYRQGVRFHWQNGYGAFSIGCSQVNRTVEYIRKQAEHHNKFTFEQEYLRFLKANAIEYDPRYIWD